MEIHHPNHAALTVEEQQQLDRLKQVIEQVTADGKLTQVEIERIKAVVWSDKVVSPEELEVITKMVREKIASGELAVEW